MGAFLTRRPAINRPTFALLAAVGLLTLSSRPRVQQIACIAPPEWIGLSEASENAGLSVTLLRRLVATGRLRAVRDGDLKVKRADLANLDGLSKSIEELRREVRKRRVQ